MNGIDNPMDPTTDPNAEVGTDTRIGTAEPSIAVLVPCYNEARSIGGVVRDFRLALPRARIFVYDNNSTDHTVATAREAGAHLGSVSRQGKGHVVRQLFADVDADVYVLVDGDGTYDAASAPALVTELLSKRLDMVVGVRRPVEDTAYRAGHRLGNMLLTRLLAVLFGRTFTDILSGYRAFSRRFVKSFPALARGFETETELTVHALELGMPVSEVITPYFARVEGSTSKLRTYHDGFRILGMILRLFETERPLLFFTILAAFLAALSFGLSYPLFVEYLRTGLVPRFPTAILSASLMILAFLSVSCGLILDTVTRGRIELKRLVYLSLPWTKQ